MQLNVSIRLKLSQKPGTLAQALKKIAEEHGNLGAIDMVSAGYQYVIRDIMVGIAGIEHLKRLSESLHQLPDIEVLRIVDRAFLQHVGGKIEISPKRSLSTREDLSMVYTPAVGRVALAIAQEPDLAYRLTLKGNSVAIVTDGSAVLGLGNIGPIGALPVMEGKSLLFKKFASVDAIPICLDVHTTEEIVNNVLAIAPCFGGINLEDIASPLCFDIEEQLRQKLDIPIFHDDQHGTAIVTLAGLFNALTVMNKKLEQVRIIINGAGAAGTAITKLLLKAGAKDVIVCDRTGALHPKSAPKTPHKKWLAENTNPGQLNGRLQEVIKGADVFIGVSGPGLLERKDVENMSKNPIVFALANPEPEIDPLDILDIAGVIATGRSDYPNQINNVLAFPGVFKGALESFAIEINEQMCLNAAKALSQAVSETELSAENIIPSIFQKDLSSKIAKAVIDAAQETKVTKIHASDDLSFDYLSCFPDYSGHNT